MGLIVLQVKLFIHTEYAIKNHIQHESNFHRILSFHYNTFNQCIKWRTIHKKEHIRNDFIEFPIFFYQ